MPYLHSRVNNLGCDVMKQKKTPELISYLRVFYKNNLPLLVIAVLATAITSLSPVLFAWIEGQLLDSVTAMDIQLLQKTAIFAVFDVILIVVADLIAFRSKGRFVQRATQNYKEFAFLKISQKQIGTFSKERTGRYLSMMTNDIHNIEGNYLNGLFTIIMKIIIVISCTVAIILRSWQDAIVLLLLSSVTITVSMTQSKRLTNAEEALSDENERFLGTLKDMLSGFSIIKTFKAEKAAVKQFKKGNAALEECRFRWRWADNLIEMVGYDLCYSTVVFLVLFYLGWRAIRGEVTPGTVLYFSNLVSYILAPIQELPSKLAQRKAARELIKKLSCALEENAAHEGKIIDHVLHQSITLQDVTFAHESDSPILKDINFCFEAGKKYAVVGTSGAGKSTLLNLLMGTYDSYRGSIKVDGEELREIAHESLYDLMSLIQQNVFIFDSSLKENLTLFQEFPKNQLNAAVEQAGLTPLIAQRGLNYQCGENGVNLSGGERQRISIARCLLRGTSVFLLDEITAALDNQTAFSVTDAILHLEGLTRIVVTHRLEASLLEQYDEIIVLRHGTIQEHGKFSDLIARKGYFYSLYTVADG